MFFDIVAMENSLTGILPAFFSCIGQALAQAPVSDLTQYPSGLASIAVVAYYAIQCEKDDLPSRRRLAGLGVEHIARDLAVGPRKPQARDIQFKGITINRKPGEYQRESWNWRTCGLMRGGAIYDNRYDTRAPLIDGKKVVEACASAFINLPDDLRSLLAKSYGFGTAGHTVAALAAFCQIAEAIPEASIVLKECAAVKADTTEMLEKYADLKNIMDEKSNIVTMPVIDNKSITELEGLFVGAHTWEGGGREVFVPCSVFIRSLGYCVGYSYGELLASSHCYLTEAAWAASIQIAFVQSIDAPAAEDLIIAEAQQAVKACRFYNQDCDLRLWFHRFGDHLASLVAGCIIASLVSLGSTSGSWVAVTAAAAADPKPVAGYTSAAWGYPCGRRAHMEARSSPREGHAIVCVKHQSIFQSFQPFVMQEISWQLIVGVLSVVILAFKFELREALGFGPFQPPAEWIARLCLTSATIGIFIDVQMVYWAWMNGSRWSVAHASSMLFLEVACLAPRFIWRSLSQSIAIRQFWLADAASWIHCLLSALFSVHLSQTAEYPVTGWIWPSAWLFAFASCGAGYPRHIPPRQQWKAIVLPTSPRATTTA